MSGIDPEKAAEASLAAGAGGNGNGHEIKDEKSQNPSDTSSLGEKVAADGGGGVMQPGAAEAELALKKLDSQIVSKEKDAGDAQDPFQHLPEHEAAILRAQVDTPDIKVSYFTLFKYANSFDWLVFTISTLCAVGSGAAMPLMTVSALASSLWR
jgi:hypothetical protein